MPTYRSSWGRFDREFYAPRVHEYGLTDTTTAPVDSPHYRDLVMSDLRTSLRRLANRIQERDRS